MTEDDYINNLTDDELRAYAEDIETDYWIDEYKNGNMETI